MSAEIEIHSSGAIFEKGDRMDIKERLSDSARKSKRNLLLYGLLAIVIGARIVAPVHEGRLSIEGLGLTTSVGWVYAGLAILITFNVVAYWAEGGWDGLDAPWRKQVLLAPRAAEAPKSYSGSSTTPIDIFDHVKKVLKDDRLEQRSEHWRGALNFRGNDLGWRDAHWTERSLGKTISEMLASLSWWERQRLAWSGARYSRQSRPVVIAPIWDVIFPNGVGIIGLCVCVVRLIMLMPGVGPFSGISI